MRKKVRCNQTEKKNKRWDNDCQREMERGIKRKRRKFQWLRGNKTRTKELQQKKKKTGRQRERERERTVFPCSKCFPLSPSAVCSGGRTVLPSQTRLAPGLETRRGQNQSRSRRTEHWGDCLSVWALVLLPPLLLNNRRTERQHSWQRTLENTAITVFLSTTRSHSVQQFDLNLVPDVWVTTCSSDSVQQVKQLRWCHRLKLFICFFRQL